MAKTIIGIFENPLDAEDVIKELTALGLERSEIRLITDTSGERLVDTRTLIGGLVGVSAAPKTSLKTSLPEEELQQYLEGVHRGQAVVALDAEDDQIESVVDVMNRHRPVNVVRNIAVGE